MTDVTLTHPALAQGVRLHWDGLRERHVLLFPEGALTLNQVCDRLGSTQTSWNLRS